MQFTLDEIDRIIEKEKADSDALEQRNYHKLQYSNPHARELSRLRTLREFVVEGANITDYSHGYLEINDRFILALKNRRWRVKGKNKWYWFKDAESFMAKYAN